MTLALSFEVVAMFTTVISDLKLNKMPRSC